jgi:hypothetical protein
MSSRQTGGRIIHWSVLKQPRTQKPMVLRIIMHVIIVGKRVPISLGHGFEDIIINGLAILHCIFFREYTPFLEK